MSYMLVPPTFPQSFAYLETPRILGTSPGSSMQYETPLYVVPTSKASTNLRERPWYGSQEGMV